MKHFIYISILLAIISVYFLSTPKEVSRDANDQKVNYENLSKALNEKQDDIFVEGVSAKSYMVVRVTEQKYPKVIFSKRIDSKLPIASITKLMTAIIINRDFSPKHVVYMSEESIVERMMNKSFSVGEKFFTEDLMYSLLIESDNDAARAFAYDLDYKGFLFQMNNEAKKLGLNETSFVNSAGTDPSDINEGANISSARDVAKLLWHIYENHPRIFYITRNLSYHVYDAYGDFHHIASSTNKLLIEKDLSFEIIGGKTGETPMAKKNLTLLIRDEKSDDLFITVVLGSDDNFGDTLKLVENIK
jgi:D-alanyl-D-alanine carboxypeptidase